MVLPIVFLALSLLIHASLFIPFIKERKIVRYIVLGAGLATLVLSFVFGLLFAKENFVEAPEIYIVTATSFLFIAIYSLILFILIPKSTRLVPQVLLGLLLCSATIFLGFAFHYGRIVLDNETKRQVSSQLKFLLAFIF